MRKHIDLPDIPKAEQTPLMKGLVGVIEALSETGHRSAKEIDRLRDEAAVGRPGSATGTVGSTMEDRKFRRG
jgi:hypothetical protein